MQVHEYPDSETQRSQKPYLTKSRRGPLVWDGPRDQSILVL